MTTNIDDTPPNTKWYFSTSVPFKTLITEHQYWLSLRHMEKNDMEYSQEGKSLSISCWLYDPPKT